MPIVYKGKNMLMFFLIDILPGETSTQIAFLFYAYKIYATKMIGSAERLATNTVHAIMIQGE